MKSWYLLLMMITFVVFAQAGDQTSSKKAAKPTNRSTIEKATFAAGCFWGVEASFQVVDGVVSTMVGYTGGTKKNPTYYEVCNENTGHAEAVHIEYNPSVVTYEQLLNIFWDIHDPTTLNRQGIDVGSQYRSAIFYHNEKQKKLALASKNKLEKSEKYENPIVTEILPVTDFYKAEDYHQKYLQKRGRLQCGAKE